MRQIEQNIPNKCVYAILTGILFYIFLNNRSWYLKKHWNCVPVKNKIDKWERYEKIVCHGKP